MPTDGELLRRYVQDRSEDSFGELVQRHVDLVYSAALRQVHGDVHLAQDVLGIGGAGFSRSRFRFVRRLIGWGRLASGLLSPAARGQR